MEVLQCLESRRSSRAFLDKEVDHVLLKRVLRSAGRSPSYMNTQPWEIFVVEGGTKKRLAERLWDTAVGGARPRPDVPFPDRWPEALDQRTKEHRLRRFRYLGVDPEDAEKVRASYMLNFRFFDAPCVVFVGMDRTLTPWSLFDLGAYVHGLLLALESEGLGGCPQAMAVAYPDIIRDELRLDESLSIVIAVSLGYPDPDAPINGYRSTRKELEDSVRWYGR